MNTATTTIDHDEIRAWAEARGGRPSVVRATEGARDGDAPHEGILRFDFREPDDALDEIDWDDFFETFEDRELALLHQDETNDGSTSRFFKFVRRSEHDPKHVAGTRQPVTRRPKLPGRSPAKARVTG